MEDQVDIMVSPEDLQRVERRILDSGMKPEVVINDIQEKINDEGMYESPRQSNPLNQSK